MRLKILLMLMILAIGGCGDSGNNNSKVKLIEMSNVTISTPDIKALAISPQAQLLAKQNILFKSAYAATGDGLIAENSLNELFSPISENFNIFDFTVGEKIAVDGTKKLLVNGEFLNVEDGDGNLFDCWLMVSDVGSESATPECLYVADDIHYPIIPSVITPEEASEHIPSTQGDGEKMYFALNKKSGGYSIKRWNGIDEVITIEESDHGELTSFHSGNVIVSASGKSIDNKGIIIYGNPNYGWRYGDTFPEYSPILFDNSLFYTKVIDNNKFFSFHISMSEGTSTVYTDYNENSIDCNLPEFENNIFNGSSQTFWISAINGKLCSITKDDIPNNYQYKINDDTIEWQFGAVKDGIMVIYGIESPSPYLQIIDMAMGIDGLVEENQMINFNFSEIINIDQYVNGIKISGIDNDTGNINPIYFDTITLTIEDNPIYYHTLKNYVVL